MAKTRFESAVKHIPFPQQAVYEMLSDLANIGKVADRVPEDKIKDMVYDHDSVSLTVDMLGRLSLRVCGREEPKLVKLQTEQSPVPFYVWLQMLPVGDDSSKLKVTAEADLNPFILKMVEKQLQEGVEQIADGLASIDYS